MHWTDILAGAGSGASAVTVIVAALRTLLTRAAKELVHDVANDIKDDINGLRQDVAELKGAFGQHVKEAA